MWRSANWHEREVFDLFGIVFRGHPNLRRIMMPEDWEGHPAAQGLPGSRVQVLATRTNEGVALSEAGIPAGSRRASSSAPDSLEHGPQHPSTHGVLRLLLELDGETIVKAEPDIGYLHTGIEKQCEEKTYQQVVPLTDRVDYLANLSNNLCYALAVERLLGLEIPPMAQWMRVMLTELTRISSHLVWLGTHAIDIGAMSVFLYCFREREDLLRIFEMFSGQRMMTSYFRVGGLALEPPRGWQHPVRKFLDAFPKNVEEYEDLLTNNPIWLVRTKGVGDVPLEDLIDLGVTGPMLRAAGLPWDIRKSEPYSSYEKFDFDIPTAPRATSTRGTRSGWRRCGRARASPARRWRACRPAPGSRTRPKVVLPDREKMKTEMEALIHHFKIVYEGFKVPAGEVYQAIESPRGEVGYYVVSDGSAKPYRVHIHGPSFGNLQATSQDGRGQADRRRDRLAGQHGFRAGGRGPMTFSPELEARFEQFLQSCPPGRQRSALIPMLLYAQDEVGAVTAGTGGGDLPAAGAEAGGGRRGRHLLLHASQEAAGEVPHPDLHQHQLPADRRPRIVGARLPEARHREQGGHAGRPVLARGSGVHRRLLLGAGHSGELRFPPQGDAGGVRPAD